MDWFNKLEHVDWCLPPEDLTQKHHIFRIVRMSLQLNKKFEYASCFQFQYVNILWHDSTQKERFIETNFQVKKACNKKNGSLF